MLFDLSDESIEALKGMIGKYLESIHCLHMDWSIRQHQVTVYEDLMWSFKGNFVHMIAKEIDSENDYYSFTIEEQDLPDPLPYEINEFGQLGYTKPISSIHAWSKIEQISFHSVGELKIEEPPYMAILFRLENDQAIALTPNFPWGFKLYFDSAAWKLVEGSLVLEGLTMDDFKNTISEAFILAAGSRALFGHIPYSLRAVTVAFDELENLCEWTSYFEREPTEEEIESQRLATTYFLTDIDEGNLKFNEQFIVKSKSEAIEYGEAILLYHQFVEGVIPPCVRLKNMIRYGEIHSSGIESLNGLVTKNLEAVTIQFISPNFDLTWYAKFNTLPDNRDLKFQQLAAERFLSSFGISKQPTVVTIVGDERPPLITQSIFERFKGG